MQTSPAGLAFLERHEGVVLRAYRCPAGVWTIGAGLTAASGVVRPHAGMTVTAEEAGRLLAEALRRNYEPAVALAMGRDAPPRPHESDAGVSFHFNTGAIQRASWVERWREGNWTAVRTALAAWNKGGGRVLPGLARRRDEEFRLLRDGDYGHGAPVRPVARPASGAAGIAAPVTAAQVPLIARALHDLGYAPAPVVGGELSAAAVRAFQKAHGLTEDGIVGRATASAVQRALDARSKAVVPAAGTAAGGSAAGTGADDFVAGLPGAGWVVAALAVLWLVWLAFTYRDALAAAIDRPAPRLARFLRSF